MWKTEWKSLMVGMGAGLLVGALMGLLIGGPTAIITYGSIKDAMKSSRGQDFSLDNYTTDIPPSVLAQVCSCRQAVFTLFCIHAQRLAIQDDWGKARKYIWWQLLQAEIVCCSVGLGSGLIATVAATAAQDALSCSPHTAGQWEDIRAKLLPMR